MDGENQQKHYLTMKVNKIICKTNEEWRAVTGIEKEIEL